MKYLGLCVVTTTMLMINANTEATCPQPYVGPPGITGPTGPVGPTGATGATGATGPYVISMASAFDYGIFDYSYGPGPGGPSIGPFVIDPGESLPIFFNFDSFAPVNLLIEYEFPFPFFINTIIGYEVQTSGYYLAQTDVTFIYENGMIAPVTVSLVNYNDESLYSPDPIALSTNIVFSIYKTVSGQMIVYLEAGDIVGLLAHNYGDEVTGVSVGVVAANLSLIQLSE